jgi:hypothetical protein
MFRGSQDRAKAIADSAECFDKCLVMVKNHLKIMIYVGNYRIWVWLCSANRVGSVQRPLIHFSDPVWQILRLDTPWLQIDSRPDGPRQAVPARPSSYAPYLRYAIALSSDAKRSPPCSSPASRPKIKVTANKATHTQVLGEDPSAGAFASASAFPSPSPSIRCRRRRAT